MQAFDRAMNHLDKAFGFVDSSHQYISRKVCCTPFAVVMLTTSRDAGDQSVLGCLSSGPAKAAVSLKLMALAMCWPHVVRLIISRLASLPPPRYSL